MFCDELGYRALRGRRRNATLTHGSPSQSSYVSALRRHECEKITPLEIDRHGFEHCDYSPVPVQ
jgi:hypothetical protein